MKYSLEFSNAPAPAQHEIDALNRWRNILFRRRLIGQDPECYGGYGYGNISCILPEGVQHAQSSEKETGRQRPFLITGTQTGHLAMLDPQHYVRVTGYFPEHNRIIACGPIRPSSESLTHGAVYACSPQCNAVLHVHSPLLWHCAQTLDIAITDAAIPYGTPEMAAEVARLISDDGLTNLGIIAMGGHLDGIIAFGANLEQTGNALLRLLSDAKLASI